MESLTDAKRLTLTAKLVSGCFNPHPEDGVTPIIVEGPRSFKELPEFNTKLGDAFYDDLVDYYMKKKLISAKDRYLDSLEIQLSKLIKGETSRDFNDRLKGEICYPDSKVVMDSVQLYGYHVPGQTVEVVVSKRFKRILYHIPKVDKEVIRSFVSWVKTTTSDRYTLLGCYSITDTYRHFVDKHLTEEMPK